MKIITYIIALLLFLTSTGLVHAQQCDSSCTSPEECQQKIQKCQEAWNMMESAKQPHVDSLKKMEADIAAFQNKIKSLEAQVTKKAAAIQEGEAELEVSLGRAIVRLRQFYIRESYNTPLAVFFAASDLSSFVRLTAYQQIVRNEDKQSIAHTASMVTDLESKKVQLEKEQNSLSFLKTETDKRAESVRKLVTEANAYQSKVSSTIASLTALQQSILNARSGSFTTSVGDVPLTDDPNASPNYNPGFSPAFAGFSFGAYTHRKGMSQYGAKGRAEKGQSAADILRAYYGKNAESKDTGGTISVQGVGSIDFEDHYLMGIAEMPSNFPKEALKAQAIAARSYAFRYKQNGQSICTTQSCQVYLPSKANAVRNDSGNAWHQAVKETRGQVIEGVVTYYSSTTGGHSTTTGWDTICGSKDCWTGDAYEKIAGSPWFYKGWYTASYLNSSAKCGKSHPWLKEEEFADILNAWVVRKNGTGDDAKRILPVTIGSCSIDGASGDPYSMGEMKDRANAVGGAFTSVSSVSVTYNNGGYTDTVVLQTNKGETRIPAGEFRDTFNLRAPGYIAIKSRLFNIEKK